MNKEDLIQKYESLEGVWNANGAEIARQCFLRDLEQLNEIDTKKVTVPQSVADWIGFCKTNGIALGYALYCSGQASDKKTYDWITESFENQEIFARAWLEGYEVEKEKYYKIEVIGVSENNTLIHDKTEECWFFEDDNNEDPIYVYHTRKELEEAGFGWVFDCPGMEVDEVKG